MNHIYLAILFIFLFTSSASAAKLELESGIFFNGDILEVREGELDFKTSFGKTITYAFEDIASIDGKPVTDFKSVYDPDPVQDPAPVQQVDAPARLDTDDGLSILSLRKTKITAPADNTWDTWRGHIRDYHMNIERVVQGVNQEFEALRRKSMVATNERQVLFYIQNFRDLATSNIDLLTKVNPPAELIDYHDKIIRHLQLLNDSQAVLQKMKFKEANELLNQSRQTYYEAMVELRDTFIGHGAPSEIITGMNDVLAEYDQTIN